MNAPLLSSGRSEHWRRSVNEFSRFARFPVARLVPTDPNAIVLSALDVFRGRLEDVQIRTNLAQGVPLVRADSEMLRRVIVNLIDNAAEAMEASSIRDLELTTRFHAAHDSVEITVADSGYGISPEDKDKLFLPHFSTKDRGTGLGLAIASRVIAEHHGTDPCGRQRARGCTLCDRITRG